MDLGYSGLAFTWCNRRFQPYTVWERIDIACANLTWRDKFEAARVVHVDMRNSDHAALLIQCAGLSDQEQLKWQHTHRFRFDATWLNKSDCGRIVESLWNEPSQGDSISELWEKLNTCRVGLVKWNKESGADLRRRIEDLKSRSITSPGSNHGRYKKRRAGIEF